MASSTTSKEESKNMALLFFMDHLMTKGGSRSIHDLSCQFGCRGFTPEMREAVGSTQEGLLDFLACYPSLFKLEGDMVSIAYSDLSTVSNSPLLATLPKDRDYEKEALDFFEKKLLKFGPEMQIKSLLGHRSQAPPEIRLLSGRHVKDFSTFLSEHPSHFIVESDRVRLKHMPEPSDPVPEVDSQGLPLSGARAKQASVEFLKSFLEESESAQEPPMPLETLYRAFCNRFSHSIRQEVASNPKELLAFLKLNRQIFFIRSNKVSIVRPKDPSEEDPEDLPVPERETFVVRTLKQAQLACEEIANPTILSVDFKTVTIDSRDFFSLLAIATQEKVYLFDIAHSAAILLESGLRALLESSSVKKVMHDCKRSSVVLEDQYGISLKNVFDTQAGNTVLQHQKGRALDEVKPVPFYTVQRLYAADSLMSSDQQLRNSQKDLRIWSQRPLTDALVEMATEEVKVLVPSIYNAMMSAMKPGFDRLVEQLSADYVGALRKGGRRENIRVDENENEERTRRVVLGNGSQNMRCVCACHMKRSTAEVASQTVSTGDIVLTRIHYDK